MINLLASSNRYGYIFYATETDDLAIIPSKYIDKELSYLSKSLDDDDDGNSNDENQIYGKNSILRRSYLPKNMINTATNSLVPYWIALNADESILGLMISDQQDRSWLIVFYDVVKLIQTPDSVPICAPITLSNDAVGGTIQNFSWNPVIPNMFAFIDGYGCVSTFELDQTNKQIKPLGKSDANDDNSSICWSPKGKQLVVVMYNGTLELYEPNMKLRKKYVPATAANASFPPCISVFWLSTYQFLLGYSENTPDENSGEASFFYLLVTCDKDQVVKTQIYYDLYFDTDECPQEITPQFFHVRVNESNIIICGLSKSLKINVLGSDELNQNSLDIWTFADHCRANIKSAPNINNNHRPILTGMALGLNSTLNIIEGNTKLPPCPMLLLSNSHGLLQVYYFSYKSLQSICRAPEVMKPVLQTQKEAAPSSFTQSSMINMSSFNNGLSSSNFGYGSLTIKPNASQPEESHANNSRSSISTSVLPTNSPSINVFPQTLSMNTTNKVTPTATATESIKVIPSNQQAPPPTTAFNRQSLLQKSNDIESKIKAVQQSLPNLSEPTLNTNESIENLVTSLNDMNESITKSMQSIKKMNQDHIQLQTRIENARHQIRLSQKENLYDILRDRELDPWTQIRLDSISNKYEELKKRLDVLLHVTHKTIHNKSASSLNGNEDDENEDFLPDFEIIDTVGTMKRSIQNQLSELSHKVTQAEEDIKTICEKFDTDLLNSTTNDSNTSQTTMSSEKIFYALDSDILLNLQATHKNIIQIRLPSAPIIELSEIEPRQSSIIETTKLVTPVQSTTPTKSSNSSSVESESFKNMFRLVHASIDLVSGAASPDQLRELSNTIGRSPLLSESATTSAAHKSSGTTMSKTPTLPKTMNQTKSLTNVALTPGKTTSSPVPNISVTPATPITTQSLLSEGLTTSQQNKFVPSTTADQSKSQPAPTMGNIAIRSLLSGTASPQKTLTSVSDQSTVSSGSTQITKSAQLPTGSTTAPIMQILNQNPVQSQSTSSTVITATTAPPPTTIKSTTTTTTAATNSSNQSPFSGFSSMASALTTSAPSTSPTVKPVLSINASSFGAQPSLLGPALNLTTSASSTIPFGTSTTASTTGPLFGNATGTTGVVTSTTPAMGPFGTTTIAATPNLFGAPSITTTATATTPTTTTTTTATVPATTVATTTIASLTSTGPFGPSTSTAPTVAPFGSGFGIAAPTTNSTTSSTSSTNIFGSPNSTTTPSSSSDTGIFGASTKPSTGLFGSATTSAPTPSIFGASTTSAPTTSIFGTTTTSAPTTSIFGTATTSSGGLFGSATTSAPATGIFSSPTTPTSGTSLFGATKSSSSPFGGGFGNTATTTASGTSIFGSGFGAGAPTTSPFGSTFSTTPTSTSTSSPFGSAFGATSSAPTSTTTFGGFGNASSTTPASTANAGAFGTSVFSFTSSAPTTSTVQSSFGSKPAFGSSFTGFGTQSSTMGSSTGFSFGGFGAGQSTESTGKPAAPGAFGSFSPPSGGTSAFGSSGFGGTPGFGAGASSFGASTTQATTSPSFTAYRK